jgi:hypothetical protein
MKTLHAVLALSVAFAGLGACATEGYNHHGGGASVAYYDGFYDDYYGPVYGGYWGGDVYYYQGRQNGPYLRDEGRHFRREQFENAHNFHYRDWGGHRDG